MNVPNGSSSYVELTGISFHWNNNYGNIRIHYENCRLFSDLSWPRKGLTVRSVITLQEKIRESKRVENPLTGSILRLLLGREFKPNAELLKDRGGGGNTVVL